VSPGKSVAFAKLVAAGNDFLFMDARNGEIAPALRQRLARRLCDRHFGIGADGAVFVERAAVANVGERDAQAATGSVADFAWDFYNSDGSRAEMCGNAARCFVRWADRFLGKKRVTFAARAGVVSGQVAAGEVEVDLPFASRAGRAIEVQIEGDAGAARAPSGPRAPAATSAAPDAGKGARPMALRALLFDTGVPHAVVEIAAIEQARANPELVQRLRWHPEAGERGANVTFFAWLADGAGIAATTFERGVEDFTLACGTGVIAAALAANDLRPKAQTGAQPETEITVLAPGGTLRVSFGQSRPGARLRGKADFICDGEFSEEFLL
jgi:diaminopimelate epimerase